MSSPNFASILDESPTEVKVPPPLPAGSYICVVQGLPEYGKSENTGTEFWQYTFRPISALEDVDQDELNEVGGFEGKTVKNKYWLTPDAIFMVDQLHQHCGIDMADGLSRRSRNEEIVNAQVMVVVKHGASKDGQRMFANVARTAPAE